MADEGQDLQEGWQAHDLRSGVAKVYAEAKTRSTLGIRVAVAWSVVVVLYGILDIVGFATVASPFWDFGGGFGAMLLAALSVSRAPGPLLGAGGVVLGDLMVIAYHLPEMIDHGTPTDHIAAVARVAIAPVALFLILNGYFGSLSIQAFKAGFSPGADWRTRINPKMMQILVLASCALALFLGSGLWYGAVVTGFTDTNVSFFKKPPKEIVVVTANDQNKMKGIFEDVEEARRKKALEDAKSGEPPKMPETAIPIATTDGLDAFAKRQVEEAFEFAHDVDESGCLLEGQGRQDRCRDDRCRYWSRVFARACLTRSRATEHFCDAVPDPLLPEAGLEWAQRMCAGRIFETCREMLYAVQGHCHQPEDPKHASAKADAEKSVAGKLATEKPATAQ